MKKVIIALSLTAIITNVYAQKPGKTADGFTVMESGLAYKMLYDAPGDRKPQPGDFMELTITGKLNGTSVGDSTIFSTNDMNNGKPVEYQAQQANFKGDLMEGIFLMSPGDSGIFRVSIDSLMKVNATSAAPWMKKDAGQTLSYHVQLISVKSAAERDKAQKETDEKLLKEFFAKNNIKPTQTESGLYYKIDKQGTGIKAGMGDTVVVNYTGMSMEGKKFDSNVDPQFSHVEPFKFSVGMGQVIRGWDEGFQIFNKGTKATLYIPSYLAYGKGNPNPGLPENGILVFDIEMLDVKPAANK